MPKTDTLLQLMRECCVQVQGSQPGSGFFVSQFQVVTCAHVIGTELITQAIELRHWKNGAFEHYDNAQVVAFELEQDIAVLSVRRKSDVYVHLGNTISLGTSLIGIGFPRQSGKRDEFDQFEAVFEGVTEFVTAQGFKGNELKYKAGHVVPGFSGGPLFNTLTNRVVGIITSTRDRRFSLGGWAKSTESILDILSKHSINIPEVSDHWLSIEKEQIVDARDVSDRILSNIPWQAPKLPKYFVARQISDRLLVNILSETANNSHHAKTCAIYGPGGTGKSMLAKAIANSTKTREKFIDGILWASFGREPNILSILIFWIRALGESGDIFQTVESAARYLNSLLTYKSVLLVLDDLWDPDVSEILSIDSEECCILVTTRRASVVDSFKADTYNLAGMTMQESLRLFSLRLHGDSEKLSASDSNSKHAMKVADQLDHFPLALDLVCALVARGYSWESAYKQIGFSTREKDEGSHIDSPSNSKIAAVLKLSMDYLSQQNVKLWDAYMRLALTPKGEVLTSEMLSVFWGISEGDAEVMLSIFSDDCLLMRVEYGFRIHDVIHDVLCRTYELPLGEGMGHSLMEGHSKILNRYKSYISGEMWNMLPNDGYIHSRLVWHMKYAHEPEQIINLLRLRSPDGGCAWHQTRNNNGQSKEFIEDLRMGRQAVISQKSESLAPQIMFDLMTVSSRFTPQNISAKMFGIMVERGVWSYSYALQWIQELSENWIVYSCICELLEKFRNSPKISTKNDALRSNIVTTAVVYGLRKLIGNGLDRVVKDSHIYRSIHEQCVSPEILKFSIDYERSPENFFSAILLHGDNLQKRELVYQLTRSTSLDHLLGISDLTTGSLKLHFLKIAWSLNLQIADLSNRTYNCMNIIFRMPLSIRDSYVNDLIDGIPKIEATEKNIESENFAKSMEHVESCTYNQSKENAPSSISDNSPIYLNNNYYLKKPLQLNALVIFDEMSSINDAAAHLLKTQDSAIEDVKKGRWKIQVRELNNPNSEYEHMYYFNSEFTIRFRKVMQTYSKVLHAHFAHHDLSKYSKDEEQFWNDISTGELRTLRDYGVNYKISISNACRLVNNFQGNKVESFSKLIKSNYFTMNESFCRHTLFKEWTDFSVDERIQLANEILKINQNLIGAKLIANSNLRGTSKRKFYTDILRNLDGLSRQPGFEEAVLSCLVFDPVLGGKALGIFSRFDDHEERASVLISFLPHLDANVRNILVSSYLKNSVKNTHEQSLVSIVSDLSITLDKGALIELVESASRLNSEWWVVEALTETLLRLDADEDISSIVHATSRIRAKDLRARLLARIATRLVDLGFNDSAILVVFSIELPSARNDAARELCLRFSSIGSANEAILTASRIDNSEIRDRAFAEITLELSALSMTSSAEKARTEIISSKWTNWVSDRVGNSEICQTQQSILELLTNRIKFRTSGVGLVDSYDWLEHSIEALISADCSYDESECLESMLEYISKNEPESLRISISEYFDLKNSYWQSIIDASKDLRVVRVAILRWIASAGPLISFYEPNAITEISDIIDEVCNEWP